MTTLDLRPRAPEPPPDPPRTRTGGARGVRADLQALRAVAVALVVLYHLWPNRLPGGYIGVDVFFVLSGFLITSHLLREVGATGSVALAQFWARRARRLLPASLLVLLVTAVATLVWVPTTSWQHFLREVGASALYVENWSLAASSVDYLAQDQHAAPTQHYWSLSAEEQFYLVWPVLIVAAAWLARRRGRASAPVVGAVLAVVTAVSFAWSLHDTAAAPTSAYFVTTTRAWQFGAGGLLAVVAGRWSVRSNTVRSVVAWAGLALLAAGALLFSGSTAFPGTAALVPVLGGLAVVWADSPQGSWSPEPLTRFGPVRWLGDVSYAVYLWHWPPIVVLPFVLGHDLGRTSKLAILVGSLVAAQLTKVLVEDPVRRGRLTARPARVTFAATAVATALVVLVCAAGWGAVQRQVLQSRHLAEQFAAAGAPCFGAGAMEPLRGCRDVHSATSPIDTAFAKTDRSRGMDCLEPASGTDLKTCRFGSKHPTATVALLGDSHAAAWYEALDEVATKEHWAVVTYVKAGCAALGTDRLWTAGATSDDRARCRAWSQAALDAVAADPDISQVFTAYRSDVYEYGEAAGHLQGAIPADVVQKALGQLTGAGKQVHVLRAFPTSNGFTPQPVAVDPEVDVPDCIAGSGTTQDPCAQDRARVLVPDYLSQAAEAMHDPRVDVVDLTDAFCDARLCHAYTGGVVVYADGSHISRTFSRSLGPLLYQRLGLSS